MARLPKHPLGMLSAQARECRLAISRSDSAPAALETRHGGGRQARSSNEARQRILQECARPPGRETDGTAPWSLSFKINRRILGWALGACLVVSGCQTVQTTRGGVVGVDRPQQMSMFTPSSAEVDATAAQQISQGAAQKGALNRNPRRPIACGALPNG